MTVRDCPLAIAMLVTMLLLGGLDTASAAKCRRVTVIVDGGNCPKGFENTVGAACANRCADIPKYTPEGTGCRDCTTSCGVGFCASSDTECAAVVAETIFSFGIAATGKDDCPDPRNGNWPDGQAQRQIDESVSRCGDLAEIYGVTANGQLTNAAPTDTASDWDIIGCREKVCAAWKEAYGVEPGSGWGTLPDNLKAPWNALECNSKWAAFKGWRERLQGR